MAINLPNLVSQLITPDLINRIAGALGLNPALAQTIVNAAIPAVLGAFASEASSPDGAKSISDLISNQDPNMLDGLVASIKGGDHANALAGGSQVLASLLGSEGLTQLSSVLGQATGTSQQAAGSILGLVGPAVTGAIASQPPESWADGNAVASLFAGEKNAIAAALPANLAAALGDSGFLDGFQTAAGAASSTISTTTAAAAGAAAAAASAASAAASNAAAAVRRPSIPSAPAPAPSRSGGNTWIYILIAIIIVGGLAWYFLHKPAATPPATTGFLPQITQPSMG